MILQIWPCGGPIILKTDTPWANLGERCPDDIKVDLKRLEFSLNGRHGFLDERGLRMLGVFDPGSELHFRGPGYWDPSREWP